MNTAQVRFRSRRGLYHRWWYVAAHERARLGASFATVTGLGVAGCGRTDNSAGRGWLGSGRGPICHCAPAAHSRRRPPESLTRPARSPQSPASSPGSHEPGGDHLRISTGGCPECSDAANGAGPPLQSLVVDAIDERAAQFYRHFDFHDLDQGRLWRRLGGIAAALGAD